MKCRHGYNDDISNCKACGYDDRCDIDDDTCNAVKEPVTDFQAIQQKYYEFREIANDSFGGQVDDIENYVNALEEREKLMLNKLIECFHGESEYGALQGLKNVIETITGQSIEEVLKR